MLLLSKFYNIHKGKSIMLLISQNIESYNIKLPENTVFRINMAWCNSLKELESKLSKNKEMKFYSKSATYTKENETLELFEDVKIIKNSEITTGDYANINMLTNDYSIKSINNKVKLLINSND